MATCTVGVIKTVDKTVTVCCSQADESVMTCVRVRVLQGVDECATSALAGAVTTGASTMSICVMVRGIPFSMVVSYIVTVSTISLTSSTARPLNRSSHDQENDETICGDRKMTVKAVEVGSLIISSPESPELKGCCGISFDVDVVICLY